MLSNESECCNNPEESGQTSGLLPDYPDKEVQLWTAVRKNARLPGQVGSILCTHPEKHTISRTGLLNTRQSSGKTHDFPDRLAQHYALIRKNTRFSGQVGSPLCTHPEKHAISRTGWLNTMHSSGKTRDFPDKLAQYYALIRKNARFPGQPAMFV